MTFVQTRAPANPVVIIFLMLCSSGDGFRTEVDGSSSLTFDMNAAKNRPVSKVITLLKDMLKQMEKEAEEDEEIYDKMGCWCETNDKIKTKAIKDAEIKIQGLGPQIEQATALVAKIQVDIKSRTDQGIKIKASLDTAVNMRLKELNEFNAKEKDLVQSIESLKAAVTVLGKHHGSLLQMPQSQ